LVNPTAADDPVVASFASKLVIAVVAAKNVVA